MKRQLLDLFCGAGGAAMGYHRAGFEVVGVDLKPQRRYPFEFIEGDALTVAASLAGISGFDAVHASPPCQAYSSLRHRWGRDYPDLIAATRESLIEIGLPYVIENVPFTPLENPVVLCGSMFGLGAGGRQLRRHRWFECSFALDDPPPCSHLGQPVGVYGHGGGGGMTRGYKGSAEEYREAMGMPWATKAEIAQAVPPAYTEWIGRQVP